MRYEAIVFGLAFMAGLGGAMSQQGVAPPVNVVHAEWTPQTVQPAAQPAPAATPAPKVAEAAPAPKPVHHHAKKVAAKLQPKPAAVAEEEHHGLWYRLFHKSADDKMAAAEPQH